MRTRSPQKMMSSARTCSAMMFQVVAGLSRRHTSAQLLCQLDMFKQTSSI